MSRISEFLINNSDGLIKDEKQADTVLIIIIIILVLVSIFLILFSFGPGRDTGADGYDPSAGYGGEELPDDYR